MTDGVAGNRVRLGGLTDWDVRRPVRPVPSRRKVPAKVLQRLLERECRCAVCLDSMNEATAVCACLHRFCRPCIEGSIRMAKPVCPTCKASVPSHRVVRDDPRYQRIVDFLCKVAAKHANDAPETKDEHHACFACSKEAVEAQERQKQAAAAAAAASTESKKKEEKH